MEVELLRYLRRGSAAVVIVRLPDGLQLAIAEWMLNRETCERLKQESEPRITVSALVELQRLIRGQPRLTPNIASCAQSPGGGQDAQQREEGRPAAGASLRRRGDLDETARGSAGTLPNSIQRTTGKHSQGRRAEAR